MIPLLIMAYGQSNADRYISKPRLESELLSNMSVITLTSGLGVRGRAYAPNGRLHKNRIAEFTIDGKRVADEGAPRVLPATYHEAKGTTLLLSAGAVASALTNKDRFASLLTLGVALTFFLFFAVNMAMVTGLLPVVGVPLPLVSYGGSAMVVLMAAFGLVQSAHVHRPR